MKEKEKGLSGIFLIRCSIGRPCEYACEFEVQKINRKYSIMQSINFKKEYDIVVCGAGVSGISAAVTASRKGAKVALLEKTIIPGGLATSGLINYFLPLCDGNGNQILFGLAEELLKLSIKYGPGSIPPGWNGDGKKKISRYLVNFSPASFVLALDELLEENGVDVWYDTSVTDVNVDSTKIKSVEVFNKSGKGIIEAKSFIDATGDADIAKFAGCELIEGTNSLSIWAIQASLKQASKAVKFDDPELLNNVLRLGADDSGKGLPEGEKAWKGISGKNVTEFTIKSRKLLLDHYKKLNNDSQYPLTLPTIPQFRTTRRIVGRDTIKDSDVNVKIENSIGVVPDWRGTGKSLEIAQGALRPERIDNLFVAGRIISAESDAWEILRVIPAAAHTGELAGKLALD